MYGSVSSGGMLRMNGTTPKTSVDGLYDSDQRWAEEAEKGAKDLHWAAERGRDSTEDRDPDAKLEAHNPYAVNPNLSWNMMCWKSDGSPPWMATPFLAELKGVSSTQPTTGLRRCLRTTRMHRLWFWGLGATVVYAVLLVVASSVVADHSLSVRVWTPRILPLLSNGSTSLIEVDQRDQADRHIDGTLSVALLLSLCCWFSFLMSLTLTIINVWWTLYYWWIDQCRQPVRWMDKALNDTLSVLILAVLVGVRSWSTLLLIAILNAGAAGFNWTTEALCRPDEQTREPWKFYNGRLVGPMLKWEIQNKHRGILVLGCCNEDQTLLLRLAATVQRCGPLLISFLLQGIVWTVLLRVLHEGMETISHPAFISPLVWSQFVLACVSALVPFYYTAFENDCGRNYYNCEWLFIVIAGAARTTLVIVVCTNVGELQNFFDALQRQ
jgi:hypothetical protein